MSSFLSRVLLCFGLLLAGPLAAQPHPPPGMAPDPGAAPAFQILLDRREELRITAPQAERLAEIGRRLEARNGPLRERLAAERRRFLAERRAELERMSPEERRAEFRRMRRQGRPPLPPRMRPIAAAMQRNIRDAVREAHALLTPEQRARLREFFREGRDRREHGRRGGMRPHRP